MEVRPVTARDLPALVALIADHQRLYERVGAERVAPFEDELDLR